MAGVSDREAQRPFTQVPRSTSTHTTDHLSALRSSVRTKEHSSANAKEHLEEQERMHSGNNHNSKFKMCNCLPAAAFPF